MTSDELVERLIDFAARVGKVVDALPDTRMGRHIGGQLVRSGTSPAPNYEEACAAESRADFVHKLSISLKELRESRCWIRLIIKTEMLPEHRMGELFDECKSAVQHHCPVNSHRKEDEREEAITICSFQFPLFNFQCLLNNALA